MARIYKMFSGIRIVAIAVFILGLNFSAAHANSIYTVENVTVDVTAENALKAREQAFNEAQVKAFEELRARMVAEGQAEAASNPEVATISMLIKDYEVRNEKLASKRYIGTYTFRFQERAVRRFFNQSGAQYSDVASKPILVLPFIETANGTMLWSDQNPWMNAWRRTPADRNALVPTIVPLGDLADVSDIGDDEALTYQPRNLNAMLNRYSASDAVIAIARPEGTAMNIQLYRTDRVRPEYVHQILERALPGQMQSQIYNRAVQSVKSALRADWKKKTVVDAREPAGGTISARVRFNTLAEWADYKRRIERVVGAGNIELSALSPREAYIEIRYQGSEDRLKIALEQSNLYLSAPQFERASTGGTNGNLNADYSRGMLGGSNYGQQKKIYEISKTPSASVQPQTPYTNPYQQPNNYSSQF